MATATTGVRWVPIPYAAAELGITPGKIVGLIRRRAIAVLHLPRSHRLVDIVELRRLYDAAYTPARPARVRADG
jgi:hypothetical protein